MHTVNIQTAAAFAALFGGHALASWPDRMLWAADMTSYLKVAKNGG